MNEIPDEHTERTQKDLFQMILNNLQNKLFDAGIECVQDANYLRLKKNGKQVGIIFEMSDGNRTVVRFDPNLQKIIEEFESSIPCGLIVDIDRGTICTDFIFFLNLTIEEVTRLKAPIEPINGHVVVVQGEYVVINSQDQNCLGSTFGIGPCRGIVIYDFEKKIVAMAHCDFQFEDLSMIAQMKKDLIQSGANPTYFKFFGTPNMDSMLRKALDRSFSETSYELPSNFTFNCKTGFITSFDILSLPQSKDLSKRMKDAEIRLKHHIPYIKRIVSRN